MKPLTFNTVRCFADTTPESAEHGDFEETGILDEWDLTFGDLVDELSSYRHWQLAEGSDWLTSGNFTVCYRELRDREETLHVRRPTPRHERYYQLALRLAGVN